MTRCLLWAVIAPESFFILLKTLELTIFEPYIVETFDIEKLTLVDQNNTKAKRSRSIK